jgi:hypothetical protein
VSKERRTTPRKFSYARAFLFTGAGASLGSCVVEDISETGAKLVYLATEQLPADLQLTMGMFRRRCRLVWCCGNAIGVGFCEARLQRRIPMELRGPFRSQPLNRLNFSYMTDANFSKTLRGKTPSVERLEIVDDPAVADRRA